MPRNSTFIFALAGAMMVICGATVIIRGAAPEAEVSLRDASAFVAWAAAALASILLALGLWSRYWEGEERKAAPPSRYRSVG